jgi:hypothetical protein
VVSRTLTQFSDGSLSRTGPWLPSSLKLTRFFWQVMTP